MIPGGKDLARLKRLVGAVDRMCRSLEARVVRAQADVRRCHDNMTELRTHSSDMDGQFPLLSMMTARKLSSLSAESVDLARVVDRLRQSSSRADARLRRLQDRLAVMTGEHNRHVAADMTAEWIAAMASGRPAQVRHGQTGEETRVLQSGE